ncbi:MAG: 6-phosphogluconolactonase [Nitrospira sp. CR1.3]|nr:6-phosphogluconolactonase [Nitrospira sp. CR1.3]
MTAQPDIRITHETQWSDDAATLLQQISDQAVRLRGRFLLALSGGSTPQRLYRTLTQSEWKQRMDWRHTAFLFGDERCVPPDHTESNYAMAQAALFQPLGIGPDHIYRMKGEDQNPSSAARAYEETVRMVTKCPPPAIPQLDLVCLGLGEDGHTASLFPGTAALQDQTHLVAVGRAPKGVTLRLTLTLGVINRASVILFLVTGSTKARMVRRVLEPQSTADRQLPAALVKPDQGRLIWLLDQPAGSELTSIRR